MSKATLQFTGQAGFVFTTSRKTRIGLDLYLSDCVERFDGFKRLTPKTAQPDSLDLDYLLVTHWHLDHFDIDSIPIIMANRKTKLICAPDCAQHVGSLHLDEGRVAYLGSGEAFDSPDFAVRAVFCDHGTAAPQAVGFVLSFDGLKVYVAGDTALRLDKAPDIAELGPFDVMIAPINGAFGNLNEQEAVSLCEYHRPELMIPCHYWMFAEHHGDPGKFMLEIEGRIPGQKYLLMMPGEEVDLPWGQGASWK